MKSDKTITEALIALGANDHSDSEVLVNSLRSAVVALDNQDVTVSQVSKFYQSPCFPAGRGNDYVNAAVRITTRLTPSALLCRLHEIEAKTGRQRIVRWGERPLDMDLLAFGSEIFPNKELWNYWFNLPLKAQLVEAPDQLILPHPRITDRAFVLLPLRDVAPQWVHPVTGVPVDTLIEALAPKDVSSVVALCI